MKTREFILYDATDNDITTIKLICVESLFIRCIFGFETIYWLIEQLVYVGITEVIIVIRLIIRAL